MDTSTPQPLNDRFRLPTLHLVYARALYDDGNWSERFCLSAEDALDWIESSAAEAYYLETLSLDFPDQELSQE